MGAVHFPLVCAVAPLFDVTTTVGVTVTVVTEGHAATVTTVCGMDVGTAVLPTIVGDDAITAVVVAVGTTALATELTTAVFATAWQVWCRAC